MDKSKTKGPLSHWERDRVRGSNYSHAPVHYAANPAKRNLHYGYLRGRRLNDHKFRRQVMIEPYVVDFVCLEAKLIIDADGGHHGDQQS